MFSVPKKQKLNKDSGRIFQEQWTMEFRVIELIQLILWVYYIFTNYIR
jgi:hypothetical protein